MELALGPWLHERFLNWVMWHLASRGVKQLGYIKPVIMMVLFLLRRYKLACRIALHVVWGKSSYIRLKALTGRYFILILTRRWWNINVGDEVSVPWVLGVKGQSGAHCINALNMVLSPREEITSAFRQSKSKSRSKKAAAWFVFKTLNIIFLKNKSKKYFTWFFLAVYTTPPCFGIGRRAEGAPR